MRTASRRVTRNSHAPDRKGQLDALQMRARWRLGLPQVVVVDNGPEFTSAALKRCLADIKALHPKAEQPGGGK
jgi:transposase InsO family protein